ncbi:oxidoreductase, Gfo/Idh/MocA family [Campylobacter blaseri]|uniref:Gfo/Idh/MocA-like oxidoreductase N-terminal domain-containing protein n=1 Tax=Campylobacter blaseri TaxID=2042961 RepID=A0A2P8R058_9BACT|nr:Gfo/Idh/MocA family oxidoreductase [Campylobacter blaseri]PSM51886.1 hypothetical protein CQ405_04790 [Campylobacter blaseri]PSM53670.1 hypothetical protein CRN67_04790 [Campylobacter blaseri]QKF85777.1 oxidoreductase, Gfo/Idh/MocA family [Campylobacter blaseri]
MKVKVALIGLGKIGKEHLSELRRSDYFELVAVCDKEEIQEFGRFAFFKDIDEMFAVSKPQAVIITTPSRTHKEIILKCMKYIKNIFVEPPFTSNLEQAREMKYAASINNVKIAIGFNDRFNPTVTSLVREFKKEKNIYSINIIRACNCKNDMDIVENFLLRDLDLVRFLTNSDINLFDMKKIIFENQDSLAIAHSNLKTKNNILVNISSNSFYPQYRVVMEICAESGIYLADLAEFSLCKLTSNGRVNLKVENEDFSIRNEHKYFYEMCTNDNSGPLARVEDIIKAREILK